MPPPSAVVGGLQDAIALNPASALGGYLPPNLRPCFQDSTAYETASLFDAQIGIAASNQTLPTADLNDPVAQHTFGVTWLTQQIRAGNDAMLLPGYSAGPDEPAHRATIRRPVDSRSSMR